MSNSSAVLVDSPAPHIARLLINRPDKRNAIDNDVRRALIESLQRIKLQPEYRAIVFGGVAGVFSAGGDLPSMVDNTEAQARERMRLTHTVCRLVANAGLPVVSAIEGVGAGGAVGLALLGDVIVLGEGSKVLFPFLKLGLVPDWGMLRTLPRRIGLANAKRILTQGVQINAPEALRIGLVDVLVADGEVMNTAIAKAVEFSKLPQDAFARMKARLDNPAASLDDELTSEENDQAVCLLSADFREGYAAFQEKRTPDFIKASHKPG